MRNEKRKYLQECESSVEKIKRRVESAHRLRQTAEEALGVWLPVCSHGMCCSDSLHHHHHHLHILL